MTPFSETIGGLSPAGDGIWAANPTDDWRQGRTLFGGLSAALCFAACERLVPDLPPLRSAQLAYVGPSTGEARLEPRILRRGKSVTFMACDMISEGSLSTRALFVFGATRDSAYSDEAPRAGDVPAPLDCQPLFRKTRPTFTQHLDQRLVSPNRPVSGAEEGELIVWVRHLDQSPPPSLVSLVALGDALPPASMPRLTTPAPISTMTWQFELLRPERFDPAGWYLIRSTDDAVGGGYSGQTMAMWDIDGEPVIIGRQSVAIFA